MSLSLEIFDRTVGPDHPCLIIAEIGVNHNGDPGLAREMVDVAADAGVDAVKFQTYVTERLVTQSAYKARYQRERTGTLPSQFEMLKNLELPINALTHLQQYCAVRGVGFLSTPYDVSSIELLDEMDVGAFKVASTDTNNIPFLRTIARTGRPVILSTGMSQLADVEAAVRALRDDGGGDQFALLHCVSEYPAPVGELNLRAMATLRKAFRCVVGFSDHTAGIGAAPWAVAMGAQIVEKHFTLDRQLQGPDHRSSVEPDELQELVNTIRAVESAMGDGVKRPTPSEEANIVAMRKSVVVRHRVAAGQTLKRDDLACKRPGSGLPPIWLDRFVGRIAARDLQADELLDLAAVRWSGEC